METIHHIPKTQLARQARQVILAVQRGQTVVVEHHGQPEAAIMDIMDYYLLRAVLRFHTQTLPAGADAGLSDAETAAAETPQARVDLVMAHYLAGGISLSRAAELLARTWLDLRTRCLRLEIPLRGGPQSTAELAAELEEAERFSAP